jgi:hypothetical protein
MRWSVEVTSLSSKRQPVAEAVQIEADSWQRALEIVRSSRGEKGPMANFSIELVEDGCRAVDASTLVRYSVKLAPGPVAPPSGAPASPTVPRPPRSTPPPALHPLSSATSSNATRSQPPLAVPAESVAARADLAQPPPHDVVATTVPSQVIFKREQDRTAALPLTYREYVYLVPPGTTENSATTLLRTQLELVRSSLARLPRGKLVNLATFDVAFQGKPPVPPLATLAWKDWRDEALLAYPRRPVPLASEGPGGLPAASAAASASAAAREPQLPPAPSGVAPAAAEPVSVPPPARVAPEPPVIATPVPMPPAPTPAPFTSAQAGRASVPAPASSPALRSPTPARTIRPPGMRPTGEDLIAELFEAMHELHFMRDALDGGDFCLTLALRNLPSRVAIVHLYDIDRREFVVTSARGEGATGLLARRYAESDPMLAAAMRRRKAVIVTGAPGGAAIESDAHDGAPDPTNVERYGGGTGARSVVIAPAMQSGRFLGAIELVDPLDGKPFTPADGDAVLYIAEQFAEFVAVRGTVLDAAQITAKR